MTDRRSYLATVALAATGLAGCAADTSEDSGDGKIGAQPTKTLGTTPSGAKRLSFGETLSLRWVDVTLSEPEAIQEYRWEQDGAEQTAKAGEGKRWMVVRTRASNTTDRTVRLPLTANFGGVVRELVYHPGRNESPTAKYVGGKVDAGETRESDMMFLLPDDVAIEQFRVLYGETRPGGKRHAWWEALGRGLTPLSTDGARRWVSRCEVGDTRKRSEVGIDGSESNGSAPQMPSSKSSRA
jgi:hypothetical protein